MVKKLLLRKVDVNGTDEVSLIPCHGTHHVMVLSCHGTIMSWYYHFMVVSCHGTISIPCHGKCASMWCALVWVPFYVTCTDVDIAISMDHKSEFGRGRREKWGMVSQGGIDEGGMGEKGEGQRGKPLPPLSCMCTACC